MKHVTNKIEEWYTEYIDEIKEDDCLHLISLKNNRGQIYSCTLYHGISINYYHIYLENVFSVHSYESETLLIAYCIEGRVEGELKDGSMSYLPEQHLCVSSDFFQSESISFPLKKYVGISIRINLEEMDDEAKRLFDYFMINISAIKKNLNQGWKCFICRTSGKIEAIFKELQKTEKSLSLLRLKMIEVLQAVQEMDFIDEMIYVSYPKQVILTTMTICKEMTTELDKYVPIEQIVEKYDISMVVFYKAFMQIYGDTPYSYLKKYKMKIAADKLSQGKTKIGDIALDLGYSNPSKFSKAFESVYGVQPKEYRKKHLTQSGVDDRAKQ